MAMKKYLEHYQNPGGTFPLSWMDELPLWSAPFGLKLLEMIRMSSQTNLLDIGFGFGFPLLEAAMRMGEQAKAFGIDPWDLAIEKTSEKIKYYGLKNVEIVKGVAENLPYANDFFDLVISNNGINNVTDIPATFSECYRVAKPGAQFVFTMNLDTTMKEFYKVFKKVLKENDLHDSIEQLNTHIYEKRKPVKYMKKWLKKSGFEISKLSIDSFSYRFSDGTAMLNHYFIRFGFLDAWVKMLPPDRMEEIFDQVERRLNKMAANEGELRITIPFATFDCEKK